MLIYQAKNLINGNCYIGQTIHNLHNRKHYVQMATTRPLEAIIVYLLITQEKKDPKH